MTLRLTAAGGFALGTLALLGAASVSVVNENEQAVIARMGQPDRVINRFRPEVPGQISGAGVVLKLPLAEQMIVLPRGLLTVTSAGQELRTAGGQALLIDTDMTIRVIDPVRVVKRLGGREGIERELAAWLPEILRAQMGKLDAGRLLLPGSGGAAAQVRAELDKRARSYGVQVIDLRIAGAALPAGDQAGALAAMRERREALTQDLNLKGATAAQAITSQTEAQAAAILQASAGRDPAFYDFYRAMRSYDAILANPERKDKITITLPADDGYLKHFNKR